jgi:SAM-dependent methyltransferase
MVAGRLAACSNIRDAGGRAQALREAVRVLRPGGRLRILEEGAGRYAAVLRDAGCTDVAVRQLDWRTWYGLPGHHMTLVAAGKRRAEARDGDRLLQAWDRRDRHRAACGWPGSGQPDGPDGRRFRRSLGPPGPGRRRPA